jgi:3-oxoacyl-[acyl-carrier-protein] synthase-3
MICTLNNVAIKAMATYVPKGILEMESLNELFGEDKVKAIKNATGIERVHVAAENETASDECFEAAQLLLEKEGIDKGIIDGLVFVSQTFDYQAPATSIVLQGRLGLSHDTVCFDTSFGCSGYINGIFQAATMISSGACKNVLLLAGDTTTKMVNKRDRTHRMVFGDCGSATLLTKTEGKQISAHICSNGEEYQTVMVPAGGYRMPSTEETRIEFADEAGNIRTLENLNMDGDKVFNFIVHCGQDSIKTMLDYKGWDKDDVDFYALHQATKFTLSYLRKRLKLNPEKAPINIMNFGNTGPTTVPLVLTDLCHKDSGVDTSRFHKVIMSAYGVGLSWGTIACDLSETNIYKPINI